MELFITIYYYVLVAIVGLMVGSFLNVCIFRIPEEKSIVSPPSACGNCNSRLTFLDLIPIFSYIFLKGKCRHCKTKFSPQYAIVELLTSLTYVSLYWKYGFNPEFFGFAFLMSILIAMFYIDLEHYIIPDGLVITALVGGGLYYGYHLLWPISFYGDHNWWNPIVGMFSSSLLLFGIAILGVMIYKTDDALGMGDVKIFLPIGLILGWKLTLLALVITVFSSAVISILLIVFRVLKYRGSAIPLGPFIVIGTYVSMFYGWDFINWYFNR